ncbi:MAG: hypothetical protein EKK56_01305 [Flavobacteriaceae bacterium]|nr:MAG: hypothetical protein EKK56_01305 [Flavobacteriaceae bacterium]
MKPIKRQFLTVDENLKFHSQNNFQITRYFNPNDLNISNLLHLHFNYSEGKITTEKLKVTAHYLDVSKNIALYEPIEYYITQELSIPSQGISKKNELEIIFPVIDTTKLLWKIEFQIVPKVDTLIHLIIA